MALIKAFPHPLQACYMHVIICYVNRRMTFRIRKHNLKGRIARREIVHHFSSVFILEHERPSRCVGKKKVNFCFFSKNVHFKDIALVTALFPILKALRVCAFSYEPELFQHRCGLNLFNRSKTSSFHGHFRFWEQKKVARDQVRWIWCIRRHIVKFRNQMLMVSPK